jgi:hypothetical protein
VDEHTRIAAPQGEGGPRAGRLQERNILDPMDASLIEELITKNKPFKIETAAGRIFEVPHRDFVSFSTRKTSLIVSYEENGTEHFAIMPLLTITSAMAPG